MQFEKNIQSGQIYTFSCGAVSSTGSYNVSFGIHYLDSSDSIITDNSVETDTVQNIDDFDRRYSVTAGAPSSAVKIRVFIRVEVTTNGSITILSPRLSKEKGITGDENLSQTKWGKINLPTQNINIGRAGASLPNVQLQLPNDDSVFYEISSNEVTFKSDGTYSVNVYASGTAPAVSTGIVFASLPNQNASSRGIGVLSGNDTLAHFSATATVNVKAGDTMTISIRAKSNQTTDQNMSITSSGLNAIEIQKID